jgi:hypothetical protein
MNGWKESVPTFALDYFGSRFVTHMRRSTRRLCMCMGVSKWTVLYYENKEGVAQIKTREE